MQCTIYFNKTIKLRMPSVFRICSYMIEIAHTHTLLQSRGNVVKLFSLLKLNEPWLHVLFVFINVPWEKDFFKLLLIYFNRWLYKEKYAFLNVYYFFFFACKTSFVIYLAISNRVSDIVENFQISRRSALQSISFDIALKFHFWRYLSFY